VRRILFWFMSTLSAVVLLFSYHTSTNSVAAAQPTPATPTDPGSTTVEDTTTDDAASSTPAVKTTPATKTASGTYTGSRVNTRWGIVAVQITVKNGKITNSQAIEYPHNNFRDQQINAYALPILNQAALSAQSANIDSISGATVTSDGYISSLQSAIDQAHL
jgi:uncharacterized protein with FMN-binding domain